MCHDRLLEIGPMAVEEVLNYVTDKLLKNATWQVIDI